jgi:integrase/recombinase XerC
MSKANAFPDLMRAFFYEWLVEQRNASIHTVRSYRDTWRLFLRFVAQRTKKKVAVITLADLSAGEVAAFLGHAEHDRGCTIGTRNCRLAAIRSFFNFVATKDPTSIARCVEILHIPVKRAPVSEPCYLDPAEVAAILAEPDRSTLEGMRDHALLSSTIAGHGYRRPSSCVPRRSASIAQVVFALPARVARNASVHSGRKPCCCSKSC